MGGTRRRVARPVVAATVLAVAAVTSCSAADPGDPDDPGEQAAATNWAPAPVVREGVTMLAESDEDGFRLHTASGEKTFLTGMNLGSTTPLHQPGELAITAGDYRRWFSQMGDLGVRVVRIYTIHPPDFYDELAAYNEQHPEAPLYLVQGVYLPDESYVEEEKTLYDERVDRLFSEELVEASKAVHGTLQRDPASGHASGTWTTDVSEWLFSWIVGVEWDPAGVLRTNEQHEDAPYTPGDYFVATDDASPSERWLATHLDELAQVEAAYDLSVPIAFANWPTADPLVHPEEPLEREDLAGVDANHVLPTSAWPAGTFASYHAYPYYPDFMRHEPGLGETTVDGEVDRYAGYLRSLEEHHEGMPVLITEVGVPSSLGSAHDGTRGRDQGGHRERAAMAIDADLVRIAKDHGMSGAFIFAWTDEWFKRTWNTMEHHNPAERRQVWHDPLTNEQYFGVVATDSAIVPGSRREQSWEEGALEYVLARADASYVHLDITYRDALPGQVSIASDTVPGVDGDDYRLDFYLSEEVAQAWVREDLDPIRLDTTERPYQPDVGQPWHRYRMIVNRSLEVGGETFPAEFFDVGELVRGTWDPEDEDYNSSATWRVLEDHHTLHVRIPWPMLGLSDPSSRTALGEGIPAEPVKIDGLTLHFTAAGETVPMDYSWTPWNFVEHTERLKPGAELLEQAFRDLNP